MNYYWDVQFEWDESKSNRCFAERGFDFAYARRAFDDPHRMVKEDVRWDYGECRFQLMGQIDGRVFVVVFAERISSIRIISARKANQREVLTYGQQTSKT